MTPKEKVLKELQEFHECFYDYDKSNTAELKRKRIEEYINKTYKVIYEMHEENLIINQKLEQALNELEELKQEVIARQETEDSLTKWVAELINELEALKKTPTVEEVIKALSEYYGRKVVFRDNAFWYKTIIFNNEIWVREVSLKDLSKDNRGDLITMIGRFYESLEGEK